MKNKPGVETKLGKMDGPLIRLLGWPFRTSRVTRVPIGVFLSSSGTYLLYVGLMLR